MNVNTHLGCPHDGAKHQYGEAPIRLCPFYQVHIQQCNESCNRHHKEYHLLRQSESPNRSGETQQVLLARLYMPPEGFDFAVILSLMLPTNHLSPDRITLPSYMFSLMYPQLSHCRSAITSCDAFGEEVYEMVDQLV